MKTLIAHEWVEPAGGAETVLLEMQKAIPHERALVVWNDDPKRFPDAEETWLARTPLRGRKMAAMLALPRVWRTASLDDVDTVLVSSHLFAHHLASRAARMGKRAFAYVHTPARYIWSPELDNRGNTRLARLGRGCFRRVDAGAVSADVRYAANSHFVADRMRAAWGVDADVIYPPVDLGRIRSAESLDGPDADVVAALPDCFILGASRLVPYKRVDAAIDVGELLDLPVIIAGSGPDRERLEERASSSSVPVKFLGRVSDELLYALYRRTALYVFLPVEDFGIMPVEAMAAGAPVLVNAVGGAAESTAALGGGLAVEPSQLGERLNEIACLIGSDRSAVAQRIDMFGSEAFRARLRSWVNIDA